MVIWKREDKEFRKNERRKSMKEREIGAFSLPRKSVPTVVDEAKKGVAASFPSLPDAAVDELFASATFSDLQKELDGWPSISARGRERIQQSRKASSTLPPGSASKKVTMDSMYCPISLVLMDNPVVCADGHSNERSSIEEWFMRRAV